MSSLQQALRTHIEMRERSGFAVSKLHQTTRGFSSEHRMQRLQITSQVTLFGVDFLFFQLFDFGANRCDYYAFDSFLQITRYPFHVASSMSFV